MSGPRVTDRNPSRDKRERWRRIRLNLTQSGKPGPNVGDDACRCCTASLILGVIQVILRDNQSKLELSRSIDDMPGDAFKGFRQGDDLFAETSWG
jgi:hypothetical protein